ncbi:septation protein SepH [Leucobacter japonicus]|uniref:septation protein SepH n=1 Tax=Leucobacter japonicus TaxID=1461259 RepID=UPI0006A79EEC|nr:septation protein SepH [Leucobacter japonicus]
MDELRFVRRDDRSLIVANDAGDEFRFLVDEAALSELRHLSRREREPGKVGPREIQALIRSGKSRAEVIAETGLDEADVERYEEPVLAERRYILERAHAVPVRTDALDEADERFGAVIAERLIGLASDTSEWSSWRDEERGWMVSLEFISHDVAHRAVWTFDHRKNILAPINPDAVNLSKQGEVGDRLIPKLRAVDGGERSGRFEANTFAEDTGEDFSADASGIGTESDPEADTDATPPADSNAEYERRKEIDQRAISSDAAAPADLSQTADLLDALRKRRGERDQVKRDAALQPQELDLDALADSGPAVTPSPVEHKDDDSTNDATAPVSLPEVSERAASPRSIWGNAGVSAPGSTRDQAPQRNSGTPEIQERPSSMRPNEPASSCESERPAKKGRASIPSWDDILFGTRSDEDPAQ